MAETVFQELAETQTELAFGPCTGVAGVSTVNELGSTLRQAIIHVDLPATVVTPEATTGGYIGVKVADLPLGYLNILACTANLTVTLGAGMGATQAGDFAVGSTIAVHQALATTEVDFIAKTTMDATARVATAEGILATAHVYDGTTTATDVYLNFQFDDGSVTADSTSTVAATGDIVITYINYGDYT